MHRCFSLAKRDRSRSALLRARYYDAALGRFTSRDPFSGIALDPVTLHKYLYANADPIDTLDPSGLSGIYYLVGVLATVTIIVGVLAELGSYLSAKHEDLKQHIQVGIYFGLSANCLVLVGALTIEAAGWGIALGMFLGIVQGSAQVLLDGEKPDNTKYWLTSFAKGWLSGTCGVFGALGGLPGVLVTAFVSMVSELIDAIATGEANYVQRMANVLIAIVASRIGGSIGPHLESILLQRLASVVAAFHAKYWMEALTESIRQVASPPPP